MAVSLTLTPRDACRVGTCAVKCQASHKAPSHGPFQAPRSCSLRGARRTSANLETNCTWPAHYGSATPLFPQSPSSRQAISRCPAAARAGKSRPWTRPHGGPGSKRRGEGNHSFSNHFVPQEERTGPFFLLVDMVAALRMQSHNGSVQWRRQESARAAAGELAPGIRLSPTKSMKNSSGSQQVLHARTDGRAVMRCGIRPSSLGWAWRGLESLDHPHTWRDEQGRGRTRVLFRVLPGTFQSP